MSAGSFRRATALALVSFAPLAAPLAGQDFGRVTGRVEAVDTRSALPGTQVRVEGTPLVAVTGEDGRYTIARVPAGQRTIRVVQLGRTPASLSVTVVAGEDVAADFALESATLTAVTVRAAGQAEALSRQQNAANIKNVVAADQMGRFPDASAPEAVQRLPGVALQRDQGEGRYVQIRGSSAATTQVTVNGEQIGSPEGGERQIALDAIPVGVLAAIEVSKAITPDMDAEAVGGSVNIVTKRAGGARTLTAEAAGGYAPLRETSSGLGGLVYGDRTADGRLAWLFSGSFGERNFGSDDVEPGYDGDDLNELEVRHYSLWRRRSGGSGSIDFKLNPFTTLYVNGLWSELQDKEQRLIQAHAIEDGELGFLHKNRLEKLSTFNLLAGAEHLFAKGIALDYRAGFTRSQEDTPFDREVAFLQEDVTFAPDRSNPDEPQPNPQDGALGGTYLFDELSTGTSLTRNRDMVGALNLAFPFRFGDNGAGKLKLGGKYRDKKKDQGIDYSTFGLDGDDITLGADVGSAFSNDGFTAGNYAMPFRTSPAEVFNFATMFASQLEDPEQDVEARTEDYDLRERIIASYVMAEIDLTPRLMLLPGVRVEQTSISTDGFAFDADAETLTPTAAENDYSNVFPMLHARFRLNESANLRAAFTRTIFRPNFIDLVPYRIVDGDDVEEGNPGLKPTLASNVDLMVERYDRNVGVISAGVFMKRLTDPIFTFTADNAAGGETSRPVNAESGEIRGVELAWQQRLRMLPGALDGLGVYANFTMTDSKATQPTGRETRLAGQADRAYNLALSYEKFGFSGQVSLNHVGRYVDELGEDAEDDLFADGRTQVDLSAAYFLRHNAQIFLEATNLGNAPYRTYQSTSDRLRQHEFYRASFQMGMRFRP